MKITQQKKEMHKEPRRSLHRNSLYKLWNDPCKMHLNVEKWSPNHLTRCEVLLGWSTSPASRETVHTWLIQCIPIVSWFRYCECTTNYYSSLESEEWNKKERKVHKRKLAERNALIEPKWVCCRCWWETEEELWPWCRCRSHVQSELQWVCKWVLALNKCVHTKIVQ